MKKSVAYKTALTGILCAQALVLSYFESLIPAFPFMPPGAKPGFSNIVNMFTAGSVGLAPAFAVCIVKAGFALVTRGFTAGLMSLCGGAVSTAAMYLLLRYAKNRLGLIGISVICAVCHNAGQLLAAAILTGTGGIFGYAPVLLAFSLVTGAITGVILKAVIPALEKQSKYFTRK